LIKGSNKVWKEIAKLKKIRTI